MLLELTSDQKWLLIGLLIGLALHEPVTLVVGL